MEKQKVKKKNTHTKNKKWIETLLHFNLGKKNSCEKWRENLIHEVWKHETFIERYFYLDDEMGIQEECVESGELSRQKKKKKLHETIKMSIFLLYPESVIVWNETNDFSTKIATRRKQRNQKQKGKKYWTKWKREKKRAYNVQFGK